MKTDLKLFIAIIVLTSFGYMMVISAHARVWIEFGMFKFLLEISKITIFIIVGIFLMRYVMLKFNLKKFNKYIRIAMLIIALMMIATLFFADQNGAKAWIRIPVIGVTIQPVEFLKIVLILFYASHFARFYGKKTAAFQVLKAPLIVLFFSFIFVFLFQSDLGSAIILVLISLCMFLAIPEKKYNKYKFIIVLVIVVSLILFYVFGHAISELIYSLPKDFKFKSQLLRIAVLFDPLKDVYNSGYQVTNSLVALTNSGIFGAGIGNSTSKYIIPEPYNDAILSVIAEELGLFGIFVVFVLYFYVVHRLLKYALINKIDIYDRLILIGIASFFMAQFLVNVGGMVGLIPMTGVTLLFISSGGSSILSAFIAIGIAQNVIRRYLK